MTRFIVVSPVHTRHAPRVNPITPLAGPPEVCGQYRKAIRGVGIACAAEVLWMPATASWVREKGIAVETRSSSELALALSVGIPPSRIIMHCDGAQAGPVRCGLNARVNQFVVESSWQVDVLAYYARERQRVVVDVAAPRTGDPVDAVLAADRLDLVGLHRDVDSPDAYTDVVVDLMGQMAEIRSERGQLLTRMSLAGVVSASPRHVGAEIDDALDDACARFRFPRPGVTLALQWPVVRPDGPS